MAICIAWIEEDELRALTYTYDTKSDDRSEWITTESKSKMTGPQTPQQSLTDAIRSAPLIPRNCTSVVTHPQKGSVSGGVNRGDSLHETTRSNKVRAPHPLSSVPETTALAPLGPEIVRPCSVVSHRNPLPRISTLQLPAQTRRVWASQKTQARS